VIALGVVGAEQVVGAVCVTSRPDRSGEDDRRSIVGVCADLLDQVDASAVDLGDRIA
jgi:hypothetical protein